MAEEIDKSLPALLQAAQLMRILRGPNGCPWDQSQGFADIAPYTVEEAYEVMDAIERGDMKELKTELGDLLFQVLFHSAIAEDEHEFTLDDVCQGLIDKMVRRHPHVFGDGPAPDWETQKDKERKGRILDGVAIALPALMRAQKLQKRAARAGFDWPNIQGVYEKLDEEITELREAVEPNQFHEEIGDLLFTVVNLARHHGVDAEAALRDANTKFQTRFERVEDTLGDTLKDASLEQMDAAWREAKRDE